MMKEQPQPDNIVSIESYLPADILPTSRFLAQLPGIDQSYGEFVGQGVVFWNGYSSINGERVNIRISHIHQETTFLLEGERRAEVWEMKEQYCGGLDFKRRVAAIPGTVLNTANSIRADDTHDARLSFCQGKESLAQFCDNCVFAKDPDLREKATTQEKHLFSDGYFSVVRFHFSKPGDLPVRRAADINKERSWVSGFENVQSAIDALIILREAISNATPLLSDETAPIPSSQTFISPRYFS